MSLEFKASWGNRETPSALLPPNADRHYSCIELNVIIETGELACCASLDPWDPCVVLR